MVGTTRAQPTMRESVTMQDAISRRFSGTQTVIVSFIPRPGYYPASATQPAVGQWDCRVENPLLGGPRIGYKLRTKEVLGLLSIMPIHFDTTDEAATWIRAAIKEFRRIGTALNGYVPDPWAIEESLR